MDMTDTGCDHLIEALIEREGGYVNHPDDRGGPTRYGITEAVARAHGYGGKTSDLPQDEAMAIYRAPPRKVDFLSPNSAPAKTEGHSVSRTR